MQYFNIQVASQLSGVASATIRAWEKRYKAISPQRGENKHRLYSEQDIEKLSILFKLTEVGQSIGKIAHLNLVELKILYQQLFNQDFKVTSTDSLLFTNEEIEKSLKSFLIALESYKIDIISHELDKINSALGPRDLCLKILVPLFREIGHRVERGNLNVAQEHTLSAIFSFHIGQMIARNYQNKNLRKGHILISTPEGELHELGIMASALLCVHYGLKFIYLGPNLPAKSLAEAAHALKPQAILLGITKGIDLTENKTLIEYLNELEQQRISASNLWIGGNLRSYIQKELKEKNIVFFSSLEAFDIFLQSHL